MMPFARIEFASSCIRSGSNTRLGCTGLGSISSIRIRLGVSGIGAGCGAAAAEAEAVGRFGRSAVRPLPNALRGPSGGLFISEYLLGQLDITFGSFGANIVADNRLTVAWRLGEPDIAW